MARLSIALRKVIARSGLPDRTIIAAIEDAEHPSEVSAETTTKRRTYKRRDMQAEN